MLKDLKFSLSNLRKAYERGAKADDIVREVYRRIAKVDDPALFIHLRSEEDVLAEAASLPSKTENHPLWGMPFVVKDNMDVGGLPTTAGCPAYAYTAEVDAFVVHRLREAGALLIGKTNLDQFATGLVGVRSPHGTPRNAVDATLVPGGSSSGSAVAVGQGIVAFSLGSDTAGSGRVPAALNDIVGLKPSLGALSASGVVPACRTLDTVSVFATTVSDAFEVFRITCAEDKADPFSKSIAPGQLGTMPDRLHIGVPNAATREFFGDTQQAESFEASLAGLAALGATIVPLDFTPFYDVAAMLYEGAWVAERYTVVEDLLKRDPDALHPITAQIIKGAERFTAADAFRGMYRLKALERRAQATMEGIDMLAVPTIPTFYTLADLEADPITPNSNLGIYTNFVNLLDMCGIAVPTAPRRDGRPGSITLLAPSGQDARVASVAKAIERQV